MKTANKNILVTGAEGFVGKNLMKELPTAVAFDRKKFDLSKPETLQGLLSNVDVIVHLAGISAGTSNAPSPVSMIQKNLDLTCQLIQAIQKNCIQKPKVIFLSSLHVYESGHAVITEETPIGPTSTYGVIKYSQELLLRQAASAGILDLVVFRCTHIYGPQAKPFYNSAIATMCHQVLNKKQIDLYGNGLVALDLVYVGDLVQVIKKAIAQPIWQESEVFNIASGKTVAIFEIVNQLETITGLRVDRNLLDTPVKTYAIDNSKVENALGKMQFTDLAVGLTNQVFAITSADSETNSNSKEVTRNILAA